MTKQGVTKIDIKQVLAQNRKTVAEMNLNGNQWRFDTERRASIDDSERHKTSWTEKNYGWHDVKREWKKCEFRTAYPYFSRHIVTFSRKWTFDRKTELCWQRGRRRARQA